MRRGLAMIAAAGAAIGLGAVVGIVLLLRACDAEPPRATGQGADDNASVGREGMQAPGTAELRQIGCRQAVVLDMARLLGDAARVREGEPRTVVTCDVPAAAVSPDCERVGAAYFAAIGGASVGRVGVRVLRDGAQQPVCSRLYAPSGADLGSF
jgi:hypothetical protein